MGRLVYILIISFVAFNGSEALADPPHAYAGREQCPVDVRLKNEEKNALRVFNNRFEGLMSAYGKDEMELRLARIIEREYPDKKVIEVSPAFYEHVLHYIDFAKVFNDIELTIGKTHPLWSRTGDFRRLRDKVMVSTNGSLRTWERDRFDQATEQIIDAINETTTAQMNRRGRRFTEEEAVAIKTRAAQGIINTYMIVGQWDEVYKAIQAEHNRWMRNLAIEIGLFALTGFALPGGLFVWTTIKAVSMMRKVATAAGTVARAGGVGVGATAHVMTMSDVLMSSGLGAVGAPAGLRLIDSTAAVANAMSTARTTDTIFICQLGRQIESLKRRGIAPYLKSAVAGGIVGAAGAGITAISPAFARAVLEVTRYGVYFAQGYSVYSIGQNSVYAIQEFGYAQDAIEAGDRELALEHLRKGRQYAVAGGDAFMNSLLLALLTNQIRGSYTQIIEKTRVAISMAAVEIRGLYASSADTLPLAVQNGTDAIAGITQYLAASN